MTQTLDQQIRRSLACYLSGSISLAEFSRSFAPLAWRAEELAEAEPDLADYAGQIDLRLTEYSDHYWTEEQLRGFLGRFLVAPVRSEGGTPVQ
jgi:hypothetical protein